jgi:hypothetical protein
MIDELIKDFLTREGTGFKQITKPEKMSQKAFDGLFGTAGVITSFRDSVIDGDYMIVGASDMVFDKSLFENGLVGETDLIALDGNGNFNIIDVKALLAGSWKKFNADVELEALKDKLAKEGVSEEDIAKNKDVIDLEKAKKASKKQYFRIQQSIYRNLFYNMTGIMPTRIGLMALEVDYDNEGNLLDAKLSNVVPKGDATIELEYMPEVETIVPLKAEPKKPIPTAPTEKQLVEQDPDAPTRLINNVGNQVVYGGAVGTLMLNSDGTYTIKNKDGIESIMYNQAPAFDGNLTFNQVGISPIKQKQSPFETIVINGKTYTVKLVGLNSAEINGVIYKINWTTEGPGKAIASLTYRANDAEIAKLEIDKEYFEDRIEKARKEYASYLPNDVVKDTNRRIQGINNRLDKLTDEDADVKDELLKTRAALEKELFYGKVKQNSKMQELGSYRLELEKVNSKLKSLRENNPKRTMRGGNLEDLIFAINSLPESAKLYKGKTNKDQQDDLKIINNLSVSSAIATKIDAILAENFPEALNTLIEQGTGAVSSTGLSAIYNWSNNVLVELEMLGSREAVKGNLTTDIDNQINAIYDLLNDLELIKLTKNGEISKRQPREVKDIFGETKVSDRSGLSKDEGVTPGQTEGVPEPKGGKPSTEQMKSKIAESQITTANILSGLDTTEGVTTEKGAKLIDAIKNASLDEINAAYIAAIEELKENPGSINTTELKDVFDQRMEELQVEMSLAALKVGDTLLPKTPIFGNSRIEPVYITKIGPKGIAIKDVVTGQADAVLEEELKNFTRMTEEAITEQQGVDLTPEDVEDFKKNTETITETLEDVTALNDTAKAVEEAETKGSFRDRLKNKKCNI